MKINCNVFGKSYGTWFILWVPIVAFELLIIFLHYEIEKIMVHDMELGYDSFISEKIVILPNLVYISKSMP